MKGIKMSDERKRSTVMFVVCTIFTMCMLIIYYNVSLFIHDEYQRKLMNGEGKPVSEIFEENVVLGYNPTESQHLVLDSYQALKTDNYTITLSDSLVVREIQSKPLCTYVNIENNSDNDLVFDKENFSADFINESPTISDDLKSTTLFSGNHKELSEVTIKPKEEEIFILCRDSDKGKGTKSSKWSLKSDDNNTISRWKVDFDQTLEIKVL